jgi:hypothetical protein
MFRGQKPPGANAGRPQTNREKQTRQPTSKATCHAITAGVAVDRLLVSNYSGEPIIVPGGNHIGPVCFMSRPASTS